MNIVLTVILAVLVFGCIILIHEAGHFFVAKLMKVKVNEFSMGMGPVLFRKCGKETAYSVRLLPIGGFVSMEGEDEESSDERAFNRKKVWQRILVVVAGAVMNIILGFIILIVFLCRQPYLPTTEVIKFNDGAVSSTTGLQIHDDIYSINGTRTYVDYDIIYSLLRDKDKDGKVDMTVIRDGKKVDLKDVTFALEKDSETGEQALNIDFKVNAKEKTIGGVLKEGFYKTISVARQIWLSFFDLITGNVGLKQLSGPVGVANAIGHASSLGLDAFLTMIAFITINIGIFNLLPLPALDGGRLVFLVIEGIRRKPINPKYEGYVHMAGLLLLFALMIFVTFQDIIRLF